MTVGIETVVSHFPDEVVTASFFKYLESVTPENMKGPEEMRKLRDPNAAEILAENVASRAMESAGLEPSDIDLIVTQNIGGQLILPGLGTYVHHALAFPQQIPAWNLQTSCASFIDGCELGRNMVLAGNYRRVLLVTVTALNTGGWGVDQSMDFAAAAGDGAGACIVSDQNIEFEILSYANHTFGEIYADCAVNYDPTENPELLDGQPFSNVKCGLRVTDKFYDFVDKEWGEDIAEKIIGKALQETGLALSDLDLIIPHQAHKFMFDQWIKGFEKCGVPAHKWRQTWDKYGNIGAVDIAATLSELHEKREIPKDSVIAFFAPGAGGHTPAMIVKYLG